ncbi:unnamed protein product, partial [Ostreobium quekettii]|eukprot:evm.model.scf_584.5 EVM.evm.TU.scf_584.5   scf_584:57070-57292(-)
MNHSGDEPVGGSAQGVERRADGNGASAAVCGESCRAGPARASAGADAKKLTRTRSGKTFHVTFTPSAGDRQASA